MELTLDNAWKLNLIRSTILKTEKHHETVYDCYLETYCRNCKEDCTVNYVNNPDVIISSINKCAERYKRW